MKSLLIVAMAAVLFVGCEKIEGQLNITKEVKLKNSKGDKHLLRVGTYTADIKANTKKKISLRINNDRDEVFVFNLPEGSRIPTNGDFAFSAKDVGQAVDLKGNVATTVKDSAVMERYESCNYQVQEQVCHQGPNGQVSCTIVYRTVFGQKWTRFFDRRTDKLVNLTLSEASSSDVSGDFHGDIAWVDRIVLNESQCR